MLKGMGTGAIVKLVLAVMVASLFVSMTTIGSLGQALQQSFTNINAVTDFTTEVEDEQTFSDLAMFVRDRAVGCEEVEARNSGENPDGDGNNNEGYPGLSDVQRLGEQPSCFGGSSTVLRDPYEAVPWRGILGGGSEDNLMPGIFSREKFEIEEPIRFREGRNVHWLDRNIGGLSGKHYEAHIDTSSRESSGKAHVDYSGSGGNYVVFFQNESVAKERASKLIEEHSMENVGTPGGVANRLAETSRDFSNRVWYVNRGGAGNTGDDTYANLPLNWVFEEDQDYRFEFQLCPGDEGYIQMNRGVPYGSGQPMGDDTSGNYYPRIVIEETDVTGCGDVNLGRDDMIPNTAVTSGQVLSITTKTGIGRSYPNLYCTYVGPGCPYTDMFNLHDVKEGGYERDLTWGGGMSVDPQRDACYINLLDSSRASAQDAEAQVDVVQGYLLEKDADSFPQEGESRVVDVNAESRIAVDADAAYSAFVENGFDGRSTEHSTPILYSYLENQKFELYGDLLCAQDGEWSSWIMCDEDGRTVEAAGREWTCNGESGSWEQSDSDVEFESAPETITMGWDEATPESREWLDTDSDSFRINSSKTPYNIGMSWEQELPTNWEEFSVTVTPHKRGHLRIGGNGGSGHPYFYFGGEGVVGENDKIYAHAPDTDDFDSTYAEVSAYETGTSYTLTIDRENSTLSVEEDSNTVWEESVSSFIFPQIRLYQGSGSNYWEDTEATVENIEVVYPQPVDSDNEEDGQENSEDQEQNEAEINNQFDLENAEAYDYPSYKASEIQLKLPKNEADLPKSDHFLFDAEILERCTLTFRESGASNDDIVLQGDYDKGALVRMNGEFPEPDNILQENGMSWSDVDLNFDGEIIRGEHYAGDLRPENQSHFQNTLYGDLLCGEYSGGASDREGYWMLCHRNADIKTNEVRGTTYECNPETGEWETVNVGELQNMHSYETHADTWIGDTIEINVSDGDLSWPGVERFRLRDLGQRNDNQVDGCYIDYSTENAGSSSHENLVTGLHSKGTLIERWGRIPDPENKDEEQGVYDVKMSDIELRLLEDVYTDSTAGGELRLRNETAWRNRLYGEMMCAESQYHGGRDVWHLCAPGLEETMKGVEAEVDGTTYTCNTEAGEWEQ